MGFRGVLKGGFIRGRGFRAGETAGDGVERGGRKVGHDYIAWLIIVSCLKQAIGSSKQPIRTRYSGHVTGYQPIRDQYKKSCSYR